MSRSFQNAQEAQEHLQHWKTSGLSLNAWAQKNGFSRASAYHWRKVLNLPLPLASRPPLPTSRPTLTPFLEVTRSPQPLPSSSQASPFTLAFPNHTILLILSDFSPQALQSLLTLLILIVKCSHKTL